MTRWRLPIILAGLNLLVWVGLVFSRPRLPSEYFETRDSRVQRTESGRISLHLITHVDPMLIVAERPFLYSMPNEPDNIGALAVFANLPALVLAELVDVGP